MIMAPNHMLNGEIQADLHSVLGLADALMLYEKTSMEMQAN